jgi:hypothetical protein
MNINDILTRDLVRNYSPEDQNVNIIEQFEQYQHSGGLYKVYDKTIIIYHQSEDKVVEFHTSNAGTGTELVLAVQHFLNYAKTKDFNTAVTYYDNPKINDLFPHLTMTSSTEKINDGKHRTYETKVNLVGEK